MVSHKFLVSQSVKERASREQSQACLGYAEAQPLFCKERSSRGRFCHSALDAESRDTALCVFWTPHRGAG